MFVYYNPNPARLSTGDCVIRAICKLLRKRWLDVYFGVCVQGALMFRMPSTNSVWGEYLRNKGFVKMALPNTCPKCYSVKDFCRDHPFGKYILMINGHVVAVENGDYYDTWDSGDEVPLFYWRKE